MFLISSYEASFTKWDTSLSGTLQAGPMGVPLSEVLLNLNNIVLGTPKGNTHSIFTSKVSSESC